MTTSAIDTKAFRSLSYGVYIVSAKSGDTLAGCIVNTFQQVTSNPARVSVAINKENFTASAVDAAGYFEATVLAESAPMELIGRFGFQTSTAIQKFADVEHAIDAAGMPYVTEHAVAHIGARVIDKIDVGTHYVFVGEVECSEVLSSEVPMTYAYYHLVKGGKTPPKASSYNPDADAAEAAAPAALNVANAATSAPGNAADAPGAAATDTKPRYGWRCLLCGYVVEMDELPEDFTCPMCGATRDMFERIEL